MPKVVQIDSSEAISIPQTAVPGSAEHMVFCSDAQIRVVCPCEGSLPFSLSPEIRREKYIQIRDPSYRFLLAVGGLQSMLINQILSQQRLGQESNCTIFFDCKNGY